MKTSLNPSFCFSSTECDAQHYLLSGKCLDHCPERFFNEQKLTIEDRLKRALEREISPIAYSNICRPCSIDCLECNGPQPNNCLLCDGTNATDSFHAKCSVSLTSSSDRSFKTEVVLNFMFKTFLLTLVIVIFCLIGYLLYQKFLFNRNVLKHSKTVWAYTSLNQERDSLLDPEIGNNDREHEPENNFSSKLSSTSIIDDEKRSQLI